MTQRRLLSLTSVTFAASVVAASIVLASSVIGTSAQTPTQTTPPAPAAAAPSQAAPAPSNGAVPDASKGLTAVEGLKVRHFTLTERPTGCTVVLAADGTVGGVD